MKSVVENYDGLSPRKNSSANPATGSMKSSVSSNNNTSGSLWKNLFGIQQSKQVSSFTSPKSSFSANNTTQVQANTGITYITSRLAVLVVPRGIPSDKFSNQENESICKMLDSLHGQSYMLYSIERFTTIEHSYQQDLFHHKIEILPLVDEKEIPRLVGVLWFCQKITSYLLESAANVAIIHCHEARDQLAFGACALLAYHRIFPCVDQIVQYYACHQTAHPLLTKSQRRYIQYICDLSFGVIEKPHFTESVLKTIIMSPVPLVNRQKAGCRPFVDIYDHQNKKIFSTYQETSKLRVYNASDSSCIIPINIPFKDDLTIHITHATISQSRRTHEGGTRICEFTINSNFSTFKHPQLSYSHNELDGIDQNEKSLLVFRVIVDIKNSQQSMMQQQDTFSKRLDETLNQHLALFKDNNEFQHKLNDFEKQFRKHDVDISAKSEVSSPMSFSFHESTISKDDHVSPDSSSSNLSIFRSNSRASGSFSSNPQSPISFVSPWHNPMKQQREANSQSSLSVSPASVEIKPNKQAALETLLDIEDNDSNDQFILERSISSDKQQHDFNSSLGSQTNLLDDDFLFDNSPLNRSIAQTCLPPSIIPTTVDKTVQHNSSTSRKQVNDIPTTSVSNSNVNVAPNCDASSQSITTKSQATSNCSTNKIFNMHNYFDDIDGMQKVSKLPPEFQQSPKPLQNQEAGLTTDIDPMVLKIREWTKSRKRNLRALLYSLSTVTWPECTWPGCQMNDLLEYEQVKKVYKKAVLHIHPDKLTGDPNLPLAKLIFVELNEAWSYLEQQPN